MSLDVINSRIPLEIPNCRPEIRSGLERKQSVWVVLEVIPGEE